MPGVTYSGLSQLVRGNQPNMATGIGNSGSIPARAGKPKALRAQAIELGVYPRSCGETLLAGLKAVSIAGLSPLVRGNHTKMENVTTIRGSIPARAGKPLAINSLIII